MNFSRYYREAFDPNIIKDNIYYNDMFEFVVKWRKISTMDSEHLNLSTPDSRYC